MLRRAASTALTALTLSACSSEGTDAPGGPSDALISEEARAKLATLSPSALPAPPEDVSNRWADDPDAARFGQRLFFDPGFSGELLSGDNDGTANALGFVGDTGKVSCAGCHVPERGFSDTRTIRQQTSLGSGWGLRRAPSLLDVGQSKLITWGGRRDSLQSQPFGVIESPVEMNSGRLFAAYQVFRTHAAEYEALFGPLPPFDDESRFPALGASEVGCRRLEDELTCPTPMRGAPGDGAEFDGLSPEDQNAVTRVVINTGKALGAYQRLLECGPSRFDAWMAGDQAALSSAEQRGAALFVGKGRCVECHSGPHLSDEKFHNVGLEPEVVATVFIDADDRGAGEGLRTLFEDPLNVAGEFSDGNDGRIPETVGPEHEGAFRTPRLRCVAERPSFMHTAQIRKLRDVVMFFNRGGDAFGYPGTSEIAPLGLEPEEIDDLTAFLQSLTGPGPDDALLGPPS